MSAAPMPEGASEQIAEEALAAAMRHRCRGASWQGLARELAWRAVTGGERDARAVETFAARAEAMLSNSIDEALWQVERCAIEAFEEFVWEHRGDEAGALAAARLDAGEEAARLLETACSGALDALLATTRRAA
jgi:predicted exporter